MTDKKAAIERVKAEVIQRGQSMAGISIGPDSGTVRLLAWATGEDRDTVTLALIQMAESGALVETGVYGGKQTYSLRGDLR